MVKKIGGTKGPKVSASNSITTSKIGSVGKVTKTAATSASQAARGQTRIMTAAEREQLHALVKEEAEKLFNSGSLPKEKRKQVEDAVRMVIDTGIIEEE